MASAAPNQKNPEATLYVGNLDERVNEALLWELFVQVGIVKHVFIPKDRVTSAHQGYAFVEFQSELDAEFASKVMNMVKVFGKPLRINKASSDKKNQDIGANLFIGNLAQDVDEHQLQEIFSGFGHLVFAPKIARDDSGSSRGFGFISYDSFEAADMAIATMNGQWLANQQITVSYAFKKEGKGERHGSAAERLLAAQAKKVQIQQQMQQQQQMAMGQQVSQQPVPVVVSPTGFVPPQPSATGY